MRFVYIDDSDFDRLAFKRLMRSFPEKDSISFGSLEEYIDSNERSLSDVLIRDFYLNNGTETQPIPDIKTFYVSGSRLSDAMKIERGIEEGYFFQKPLKPEDIISISEASSKMSISTIPDYSYLEDLSDGDKEFEQEMIDVFLTEVPVQLDSISKGMETKDFEKVSQNIHGLRTKIRTFGLSEIDELAEKLEFECKNSMPTDEGVFGEEIKLLHNSLYKSIEEIRSR